MKQQILNIISIILLAWIIGGGSTQYRTIKPSDLDERLPVFGEHNQSGGRASRSDDVGMISSSSEKLAKNESIINAFSALKDDPCNRELRKNYAKLAGPLMKEQIRLFQSEQNDEVYKQHLALNQKALSTFLEAFESGYISRSDIPFMYRSLIGKDSIPKPACSPEEQSEYDARMREQ